MNACFIYKYYIFISSHTLYYGDTTKRLLWLTINDTKLYSTFYPKIFTHILDPKKFLRQFTKLIISGQNQTSLGYFIQIVSHNIAYNFKKWEKLYQGNKWWWRWYYKPNKPFICQVSTNHRIKITKIRSIDGNFIIHMHAMKKQLWSPKCARGYTHTQRKTEEGNC